MEDNKAFLVGFFLGTLFKVILCLSEGYFIYDLFQKDWSWNQDFIKQLVLVLMFGFFIWELYLKKEK